MAPSSLLYHGLSLLQKNPSSIHAARSLLVKKFDLEAKFQQKEEGLSPRDDQDQRRTSADDFWGIEDDNVGDDAIDFNMNDFDFSFDDDGADDMFFNDDQLVSFFDNIDDGDYQDDGFGLVDDEAMAAMMEQLSHCGIDFEAVQQKIMLLMISGNLVMDPEDAENMSAGDQVNMINQLIGVVAPEGEGQCNTEQLNEIMIHMTDFGTCMGFDFENDEELNDQESMEDVAIKCGDPVANMLNPDACMDAMMESPMGKVFRFVYHETDAFFNCLDEFVAKTPTCYASLQNMMDANPEEMALDPNELPEEFDEAYFGLTISFGALKELICVDEYLMRDLCYGEMPELDGCLPQSPIQPSLNCAMVEYSCQDSMFGLLPLKLSGGDLPELCLEYDDTMRMLDVDLEDINARFSAYSVQCLSTEETPSGTNNYNNEYKYEKPNNESNEIDTTTTTTTYSQEESYATPTMPEGVTEEKTTEVTEPIEEATATATEAVAASAFTTPQEEEPSSSDSSSSSSSSSSGKWVWFLFIGTGMTAFVVYKRRQRNTAGFALIQNQTGHQTGFLEFNEEYQNSTGTELPVYT